MAHCLSCYSYVIPESPECASCRENRNKMWVVNDTCDTYGLHNREWNFRYKMIKGKLAETLVEQLFLSHKYTVYRYGVSNMPSFVVSHRLYREKHFVEVRFSVNGCFSEKELEKDYPYDDALIIVVSTNHIKCLSVRELRQGWEITPDCNNYLANRSEFQLRKDVVTDFCKCAESFFEAV